MRLSILIGSCREWLPESKPYELLDDGDLLHLVKTMSDEGGAWVD